MRLGLRGGNGRDLGNHRYFCVAMAASAFVACGLLVASRAASANGLSSQEQDVPLLVGLALIFLMNLPINAFWYSLNVLALSRARMLKFTRVPPYSDGALASKTLVAAVCVSALGALIDLFAGEDEVFWFRELGEATMIAAILVFASVVVVSMTAQRLKAAPALIIAAAFAVIYLVHWIVVAEMFYGDGTSENPTPYVATYGIICAILSVATYLWISRTEPCDACSLVESEEEA
jgi:peptidoglycan/LPS O-acetylase OafA/YrhL